jgi:hypothetical protein
MNLSLFASASQFFPAGGGVRAGLGDIRAGHLIFVSVLPGKEGMGAD